MTAIVLIRHASTAWSGVRYCGSSDPPLSPTGRAAATRLAADLARDLAPGTRIVSSPAQRAVVIARAIRDAAGLTGVEIDARWREADLGIAEGRTFDELVAIEPRLAARLAEGDVAIDWPDGETYRSLADRVGVAWSELVADGRPAVVVTHAGPFMHARALAERRTPSPIDLVAPATAIRFQIRADRSATASVLPSRA